ncbi:unnamed protein product [Acanthoscelides obtectus]|uniref:Uncharacterized protein n=1 Tax=Acanthoscelides obtectus TaxID=200917 RepID=A0A9P0LCZ2_ACAOB|nr:unnamed protein product [Acanthoscelides obtectus]CAK1655746.1 hypothetical protein AOBTE_LOCUS19296 [Acanthoscelides obtectus]
MNGNSCFCQITYVSFSVDDIGRHSKALYHQIAAVSFAYPTQTQQKLEPHLKSTLSFVDVSKIRFSNSQDFSILLSSNYFFKLAEFSKNLSSNLAVFSTSFPSRLA